MEGWPDSRFDCDSVLELLASYGRDCYLDGEVV